MCILKTTSEKKQKTNIKQNKTKETNSLCLELSQFQLLDICVLCHLLLCILLLFNGKKNNLVSVSPRALTLVQFKAKKKNKKRTKKTVVALQERLCCEWI